MLRFGRPSALDSGGPWFDGIYSLGASPKGEAIAMGMVPGGYWATADGGKAWRRIFVDSRAGRINGTVTSDGGCREGCRPEEPITSGYTPAWQDDTWNAIVDVPSASPSASLLSMHNLGNISVAAEEQVNSSTVCIPEVARWSWHGTEAARGEWTKEIERRQLCFHGVPNAGTRGVAFRKTGGSHLRLADGKTLLLTVMLPLQPKTTGGKPSILCFASIDGGYDWIYRGTIARPEDVPQSREGPNENTLALLADGETILCVMRLDAGDRGGYLPYAKSFSADGGYSWSRPTLMGHGIGSARPRLLRIAKGPSSIVTGAGAGTDHSLLLSGGRTWGANRDVFLWLNTKGNGVDWAPQFSISYWHNLLEPNASRHFTAHGVNHSTHWPRECTSYTSLIATGDATAAVVYNLAVHINGSFYGGAFSMPVTLV